MSLDEHTSLRHALQLHRPAPLLVGLSGGLDSTALLHALAADAAIREHGLRAIHVHHGLQADATEWAAHCRNACDSLGVALQVVEVSIDRHDGNGLEAAARKARYAAFATAMEPGEVLVTAHHRDDQAETFLLRALRGSGPDGLAAMRPWRNFAAGWQWRPLLDVPRDVLLAYAQHHQLGWVDDASNGDLRHDRNFLRHRILPLLRERWPQVDSAFSRSAVLSADAVELLAQEDALALAVSGTLDPRALSVHALLNLQPARRARVLRRWIEGLDFPPLPGEGVAQIETALLPARADARARFEWRGVVIERWRDLLHVQHLRAPLPADWEVQWLGREPLPLPEGDRLVLEGITSLPAPLRVAARQGGERIVLPGRTHSHSLKNVLQDLGVPPWEREALPLLFDEAGELMAVADLAYAQPFDAWLRHAGGRLRWLREGSTRD